MRPDQLAFFDRAMIAMIEGQARRDALYEMSEYDIVFKAADLTEKREKQILKWTKTNKG